MRLCIQRVSRGRVTVDGRVAGEIGHGLCVLVGISPTDGPEEVKWACDKIVNLRVFNDTDGKMNLSLTEVGGDALIVSQFTLYGDARKGRRPSFIRAAAGPEAESLYDGLLEAVGSSGVDVQAGIFGAMMEVDITNDGPVTLLLDSEKTF